MKGMITTPADAHKSMARHSKRSTSKRRGKRGRALVTSPAHSNSETRGRKMKY